MTPPQPAENLSEVFRFLGQQAGMEPEPVGVAEHGARDSQTDGCRRCGLAR